MKTVMVTEAGGYIGSVLTPMLMEQGYRVVAVDRFFFGRERLPPEDGRLRAIKDDIRQLDVSLLNGTNTS